MADAVVGVPKQVKVYDLYNGIELLVEEYKEALVKWAENKSDVSFELDDFLYLVIGKNQHFARKVSKALAHNHFYWDYFYLEAGELHCYVIYA